MASHVERRAHERIALEVDVNVRRLGLRGTPDAKMQAVDVSMGGIRIRTLGTELQAGDVVMVTLSDGVPLPCKGLVVTDTPDPSGIARHVHVAWTNLDSVTSERLGVLLDAMAAEAV